MLNGRNILINDSIDLIVNYMQTIQLTSASFEFMPRHVSKEVLSLQEGSYIFRNRLSQNPITACEVTRRSTERTDRLADPVEVLSWA